jgi:hypothetical protein
MALTPGYGETPLPHGELTVLLPKVVDVLDKPIMRAGANQRIRCMGKRVGRG